MSIGAAIISQQEGNGVGVTWDNWTKPISTDDDFTFAAVVFLLLWDMVLYLLIALYIEGVFPGEFGIPRPWYFPCSPKFWCGAAKEEDGGAAPPPAATNASAFEPPPPGAVAGISLVGLRKVFGTKVAVAGYAPRTQFFLLSKSPSTILLPVFLCGAPHVLVFTVVVLLSSNH